ncbi:MAG: NAD(P)-dependent alcohol dehydrogenase, partial [Caldilineaceae bacterium]
MKAIVYSEYGSPDVLRLEEVDKPTPAEGEVLVKVHAASLNAADWHIMRGEPKVARPMFGGLRRPSRSRFGIDGAGVVEAVGAGVTQFKPGDQVFGDFGGKTSGSCAEYATPRAGTVVSMPLGCGYEDAAAVPMAGCTALQALSGKGNVQPGMRVLIHGAGGGVGTFAVQIARALGADVTAVCGPQNVELVKELGARRVIDYSREDFLAAGEQWELILGVNGYRPIRDYRRALTADGTYLMVGGGNRQLWEGMMVGPLRALGSKQTLSNVSAESHATDLLTLTNMIEAEEIRPIIDRRFPLEKTADAMRYLESGHARGKVV